MSWFKLRSFRYTPVASNATSQRSSSNRQAGVFAVIGFVLFVVLAGYANHASHHDNQEVAYSGRFFTTAAADDDGASFAERLALADLGRRLDAFLDRSIPPHDEMTKAGEKLCPYGRAGRDYFWMSNQRGRWGDITSEQINASRWDLVGVLDELHLSNVPIVRPPVPQGAGAWHRILTALGIKKAVRPKTRGIITTGGNGHTIDRIAATLDLLRNTFNDQTPMEIFSFEDERDPAAVERLEEFGGVSFVYLDGAFTGHKRYDIKGRAFIATSFDEFVYVDSDSIPLQRIDTYFDSRELRDQGAAFWPDLYKDDASNAVWRFLGYPCDGEWAQEAGQVVYDRTGNGGLNEAVLHLAAHMQAHEPWSLFSMGDKDTWRYAFKLLDLPVPWTARTFSPAGYYGDRYGKPSKDFCGHTMLQWGLTPMDPEADQVGWHPEPGFAHGNMLKFHQAPDGSDTTKPLVFTHVQRPARDLLLEDDIDDTRFNFNWEPRHCFTLSGSQVLTIPFDETFRAGREADVRDIQRAALRFVSVEVETPI